MRAPLALALIAAFCTVNLAADGSAQGAGRRALLFGRYHNASPATAEASVERALRDGAGSTGALERGVARARLRSLVQIPRTLEIAREGDLLVLTMDGERYAAPPDGSVYAVPAANGERVEVAFRLSSGGVYAVFRTGAVTLQIDFVLTESGEELSVEVTLLSDDLASPLRYELTYRRG
jgi:hypothetical protein